MPGRICIPPSVATSYADDNEYYSGFNPKVGIGYQWNKPKGGRFAMEIGVGIGPRPIIESPMGGITTTGPTNFLGLKFGQAF